MLTSYSSDIEHWQEASPRMHPEVRPVLLLVAYECMPDRGSEARAGWERVLRAAREFVVHTIVSAESLAAIERHREANPIPGNIFFHTPKEDFIYGLLKSMPSLFAYDCMGYRHWQRLAYQLARELHRKHCFSLVHQVNGSTFAEPGYAWRLGIPFIWGPVSGTQNFPVAFLAGLPAAEQVRERVRKLSNRLSLRKHRVKAAAKRASVLLAANTTNQSDFERAFRRPIELLPETAIDSVSRPETAKFRAPGPLNILWSGEFTTRKALPLLLEAVANLGYDVDYKLHILGRGPLEAEWKALAVELGVAKRCTFLGDRRMADTIEQLEWAHLFVFTSLRDTTDDVVLEALGHGVPVMCFDHQGSGDIVTPSCGIKIPVTHPGHAIAAMASSIRSLSQDRSRLLQLSAGACDRARNYLWSENSARVISIYRSLVLAATVSSQTKP
jgi:glycosyltransferase involved in cell wall biosynthesis